MKIAVILTGHCRDFHKTFDTFKNNVFDKKAITPRTGDYMIFPSFTYHHVNPYYSSLRICVPVDLYLYRGG